MPRVKVVHLAIFQGIAILVVRLLFDYSVDHHVALIVSVAGACEVRG